MTTPQELIRIAEEINPQKLKQDPWSALRDAYTLLEAQTIIARGTLELERQHQTAEMLGWNSERPKPLRTKRKRGENEEIKNALGDLRKHITDRGDERGKMGRIARSLGISHGALAAWLSGKWKPSKKSVATIRGFLEKQ